jgi:hypothetical protein
MKSYQTLWAHRTSRHGAPKVTPFESDYGQEAMLPVEINLQTHQVIMQGVLSAEEYLEATMDRIDNIPQGRLKALEEIEREKQRVIRAYNKKSMSKIISNRRVSLENDFAFGDM